MARIAALEAELHHVSCELREASNNMQLSAQHGMALLASNNELSAKCAGLEARLADVEGVRQHLCSCVRIWY